MYELRGLLSLLGAWALRHPGNTLVILVVVIGLWSIVYGVVEISAAFRATRRAELGGIQGAPRAVALQKPSAQAVNDDLAKASISLRQNHLPVICASRETAGRSIRRVAGFRYRTGNAPRAMLARCQEHRSSPDSRLNSLWTAVESRGIPLRTILVSVAIVGVAYLGGQLIYRLRAIILILIVAGFVALVLNPLVVALEHVGLKRRGQAVAVVTLLAVVVFVALAAAFGYPLVNGLTHLADRLPTYIRQAEHGTGWIGRLARRYHAEAWVNKNAPKLTTFAKSLAKPALQLGKGALTLLVTLFTVFALVVLLLLEGSKLREGLLGLISPQRASRYKKVAGEVNRSVIGYVLGDLLTSVVAGVVVFVALVLLGVPFPLLWALWVALVDFVPVVGGALAGIPTVLFAAGHSLSAGITTLIVFLVYTFFENHVLNPVVMSKTVRVNPLLVLLSILIGASIGSWIGSLLWRLRIRGRRHPYRRRLAGCGAGALAGNCSTRTAPEHIGAEVLVTPERSSSGRQTLCLVLRNPG